jgi:hypothetical protein
MRTKSSARQRAAVIAALITAAAVAGVAYAAIPTTGGNLPACVDIKTGAVRILEAGAVCNAKETAIQIATADPAGRVADAQLLDGNDSTAFLQDGTPAGGMLAGTYPDPIVRADAIFGNHIKSLTFSDGDLTPVFDGFLKSFEIPTGAIQSDEIANGTIQGIDVQDGTIRGVDVQNGSITAFDIDEMSLPALDGHDAFTKKCDPHPDSGYILCAAVSFTTGRAMPIFMTVAYSVYHEVVDQEMYAGACKTRLDGIDQGSVPNGDTTPTFDFITGGKGPDGGVPMVDVIAVPAGNHTLEFLCWQDGSDDIVFGDIRLAVIELGMD